MKTPMSSLFQYKIKTFWKQQTKWQTANSGSVYFRTFWEGVLFISGEEFL